MIGKKILRRLIMNKKIILGMGLAAGISTGVLGDSECFGMKSERNPIVQTPEARSIDTNAKNTIIREDKKKVDKYMRRFQNSQRESHSPMLDINAIKLESDKGETLKMVLSHPRFPNVYQLKAKECSLKIDNLKDVFQSNGAKLQKIDMSANTEDLTTYNLNDFSCPDTNNVAYCKLDSLCALNLTGTVLNREDLEHILKILCTNEMIKARVDSSGFVVEAFGTVAYDQCSKSDSCGSSYVQGSIYSKKSSFREKQ